MTIAYACTCGCTDDGETSPLVTVSTYARATTSLSSIVTPIDAIICDDDTCNDSCDYDCIADDDSNIRDCSHNGD